MKTAEEILNEVLVDVEDRPVFFREQDVADLIGQAQKEAFKEGQSNPKIKQLEWEHGIYNRLLSKTLVGDYTIAPIKNGYQLSLYNKNEYYWLKDYVNTIDEAKQFAQKDFETRIKECLITE